VSAPQWTSPEIPISQRVRFAIIVSTSILEEYNGSSWVSKTIGNIANSAVTVAALASAVLDLMLKPGMITATGRATADTGWLLCDGSAVSRTTYATLFGVIGITFGAGDGSTTFNLPDLRGRFPLGKAVSGTGSTLGGTLGALDHVHAGPSHNHNRITHTTPWTTHNHTIAHTHSTPAHVHSIDSSSSYAQICLDANTLFEGRNNSVTSWAADVQATTTTSGSSTNKTRGAIVCGSTTSGGAGTTGGASTAYTGGSGQLTTDGSSTPNTGDSGTGNTGAANPPAQVVNYQIKT